LKDRRFPGRDALAALDNPDRPRRVGLVLSGKRVPRQGFAVLSAGREVGRVTSGTFSPTLDVPIAMAYVEPPHAAVGTSLAIDIRSNPQPARVVALPFYRRP
jgi:aminomethyltransferase